MVLSAMARSQSVKKCDNLRKKRKKAKNLAQKLGNRLPFFGNRRDKKVTKKEKSYLFKLKVTKKTPKVTKRGNLEMSK